MGRSHYSIDRRHYRGVFKPGFFAHLSQTKFWQTDNDPYLRTRRRRRKVTVFITILALVALCWIVIESASALKLF